MLFTSITFDKFHICAKGIKSTYRKVILTSMDPTVHSIWHIISLVPSLVIVTQAYHSNHQTTVLGQHKHHDHWLRNLGSDIKKDIENKQHTRFADLVFKYTICYKRNLPSSNNFLYYLYPIKTALVYINHRWNQQCKLFYSFHFRGR